MPAATPLIWELWHHFPPEGELLLSLPTAYCGELGVSLWGVTRSEPRHQISTLDIFYILMKIIPWTDKTKTASDTTTNKWENMFLEIWINWPFKVWTSNSLDSKLVWFIPVNIHESYLILCLIQTGLMITELSKQRSPIFIYKWGHLETCLDILQPAATWVGITTRGHFNHSFLISEQSQQRVALLLWLLIKTWLALSNPELMVSSQQIRVQSGCLILIQLMHLQAIFSRGTAEQLWCICNYSQRAVSENEAICLWTRVRALTVTVFNTNIQFVMFS